MRAEDPSSIEGGSKVLQFQVLKQRTPQRDVSITINRHP